MVISAIIGATYGVMFQYEAPNVAASLAWGLVYGAIWWFLGPLTLFPILLGGSFVWTIAQVKKSHHTSRVRPTSKGRPGS